MTPTTASEIRDQIISLVSAIIPRSQASSRFRLHREEQPIDVFGDAHPDAVLRLFSVLDLGRYKAPTVSGIDTEWRESTFIVLVGYPATSRAGKGNARSIEDMINQDGDLIDEAIGLRGFGNFTKSVMMPESWDRQTLDGENTRWIRIETTHGYWRNKSHVPI